MSAPYPLFAGTPGLQVFKRDGRFNTASQAKYELYGTIKPLYLVAISANQQVVWVSDKKVIYAFDPITRSYYNNGLPIAQLGPDDGEVRGMSAAPYTLSS